MSNRIFMVCEAIDRLRTMAKAVHLELDIGIPEAEFFDVARALNLELRHDRDSYAGKLPCAYYDNVKLTVAFIKETPRFHR